ncbi:MAG: HesA/MoeB/ThiF family protein [Neisseria sp.]|nr:HesA/MoeB/ThiF family protein [Neisseria sp.]
MNDHELLRYSRHILLDEVGIEGQEKWQQSAVLIIGCGGLGNAAAAYLAAAGVGKIVLIDDDVVDESNLQRQIMFGEANLGEYKAIALQKRLQQNNSLCQIEAICERIDAEKLTILAQNCDVVLDCSDNFATRHLINQVCVEHKKPLISGAAIRFSGQLATYRADLPEQPCYACLFDEQEHASDGACATTGVFAPLVGIIGSMQAAEALKVLANLNRENNSHTSTLHLYHALENRWQVIEFQKNPDCRICCFNTKS